jgi:hypothetical protein
MEVKISRKKSDPVYHIEFNHNMVQKVSNVIIRKNGKFVITGEAICEDNTQYCRNCCRKKALEQAFLNIKDLDENEIPRTHRHKIWDEYRKMTKVPRWQKTKLNRRDVLLAKA